MKSKLVQHHLGDGWKDVDRQLDSEQTLVVAFGSRDYLDHPEVFEELREHYPSATILGCSTSGEIHGRRLRDESLSVAVTRFESTGIRKASVTIDESTDSAQAGRDLAEQLLDDDLAAVFVLSNGLLVNGTALVSGLNSVLGPDVVVTGGLAGDGPHFERTWVLEDDEIALDKTVAVGFYGDQIRVNHGSQGGWDRFGPTRKITAASDNKLLELDGNPALALYKQYLGEHADELPAAGLLFPLEIRESDNSGKRLVRTILAVDEEENSLTFAGDMPVGWKAQLMKANFDRLVDGAEEAARTASEVDSDEAPICLAISCVGRRLVLQDRAEDELEAVADLLPENTVMAGFYSYGELSPHVAGEPCDLHNQTMTLTLIYEASNA